MSDKKLIVWPDGTVIASHSYRNWKTDINPDWFYKSQTEKSEKRCIYVKHGTKSIRVAPEDWPDFVAACVAVDPVKIIASAERLEEKTVKKEKTEDGAKSK